LHRTSARRPKRFLTLFVPLPLGGGGSEAGIASSLIGAVTMLDPYQNA
jgi:hypothetical protein